MKPWGPLHSVSTAVAPHMYVYCAILCITNEKTIVIVSSRDGQVTFEK
jgi:hypothetical protein